MNADIDGIDARVKSITEAEQREADATEAFAKIARQPREGRGGESPVMDEVRSFLRGERGALTLERDVKFRDLTKGVAASGGATVPISFYGQLVEHMIDNSGVMQANPTVLGDLLRRDDPDPGHHLLQLGGPDRRERGAHRVPTRRSPSAPSGRTSMAS